MSAAFDELDVNGTGDSGERSNTLFWMFYTKRYFTHIVIAM